MRPAKFAEGTPVSVEKSRAEVESILRRYGADAFGYTVDGTQVRIAFRLDGRHFRFALTMPDPKGDEFWLYNRGSVVYRRAESEGIARHEQACRQKWRALCLVIKAKLEAVAAGISTVEDEFLAAMILPDRQTVSEWMAPQIERAYRIGSMPAALQLEGPK